MYTHQIIGIVENGQQRGKKLGFPTANIKLHKEIPEGVYASKTTINNETYLSATFIGASVTFGERDIKSETYIIDFDKRIYGKEITVELFKKIREGKKFPSKEALIEQMEKDVEDSKKYFTT